MKAADVENIAVQISIFVIENGRVDGKSRSAEWLDSLRAEVIFEAGERNFSQRDAEAIADEAVRIQHPLTSAERQADRTAALNAIAQAAGWKSWSEYETAVKRGGVKIEKKIKGATW